MSINRFIVSGNVAAEPRKAGTQENPILNFTIINNVRIKKGDEWQDAPVSFDCSLFGKRAKALANIIVKGMPLTIEGAIYPNNYEKDGQKFYKYNVRVSEIVLPRKIDENEKDNIPF